jgi:hypothetical protein
MKKSINSTPQWPLCHNTKYGRHDSNMLYISYPKGATDQFVIYHFKFLILSSKGIEPFTALTNSFTENHHYQSDHLPLKYKFVLNNKLLWILKYKLTQLKLNYIFKNKSTWTWTRTFSLKGRHSTTQVLLSYLLKFFLIYWVDQIWTDIIHYQKMMFFQIKLQLILFVFLLF